MRRRRSVSHVPRSLAERHAVEAAEAELRLALIDTLAVVIVEVRVHPAALASTDHELARGIPMTGTSGAIHGTRPGDDADELARDEAFLSRPWRRPKRE